MAFIEYYDYRVVRDILGNPNWEEHILSTDSAINAPRYSNIW